MFRYYGIDLLGLFMIIIGVTLVASPTFPKKKAFYFSAAACLPWVVFGFMTSSSPMIVANLILAALYIRGAIRHE